METSTRSKGEGRNGYCFGADFRINQKTTPSYTQSLEYYDGGQTYSLNLFNSRPLVNGQAVTFGLPWFNSGSPRSTPQTNEIANPACNGPQVPLAIAGLQCPITSCFGRTCPPSTSRTTGNVSLEVQIEFI